MPRSSKERRVQESKERPTIMTKIHSACVSALVSIETLYIQLGYFWLKDLSSMNG